MEAELAAAKKDHAKLYKAWEEGKDKNAKLTKMLVESKRMLPSFLPYPPYTSLTIILTTFHYPSFAEKIIKANEILKVNEDIVVLKNEIEGLQKEREENLKLHEQTMKSYQESSGQEIKDLKAEISEKDIMLENW